jgi:mono/diheme cytochrome c family protein
MKPTNLGTAVVAVVCAVVVAGGASAAVERQVDVSTTFVPPSMAGRDSFRYYCATCHGRDGRGNGPVAAELKTRPADLTRLAAGNGGRFPLERVRSFVAAGRPEAPTHGSSDMPVWGPIFQVLDPSDKVAQARIDNLVMYIDSIQVK